MSASYKSVAVRAAREAGELTRRFLGRNIVKSVKGHGGRDYVTKADIAAQGVVLRILKDKFPDHNFWMEESASVGSGSQYTWLVDPIDGTTNFFHRLPMYSVSIALAKGGKVILGVVYAPLLDELYVAERGKGAFLNGRRISVSKVADLNSSIVAQSLSYQNDVRLLELKNFTNLLFKVEGLRIHHSAAIDLCYVASARTDAYSIIKANPWDLAAGVLIVQEAGGRVTHLDGTPYNFRRVGILASNGALHPLLCRALSIPLRK